MIAATVFSRCVEAIRQGSLIERVSTTDKEYHFQNWFKARLEETELNFEVGGGIAILISAWSPTTEGYELKGLAYPGRDANFDSNSQVPTGFHNGRTDLLCLRALSEEARRRQLSRDRPGHLPRRFPERRP